MALTDDNSGYYTCECDVIARLVRTRREFQGFQTGLLIEEGGVDCRAYATGDVVMIDGILSGLIVSQVESTKAC